MHYYINIETHEVHRRGGCNRMPYLSNRASLGVFLSFPEAIREAWRMGYGEADACAYCLGRFARYARIARQR